MSEIARRAFEYEITNYRHTKENTVDTAIERLRASKAKVSSDLSSQGYADGYEWAKDHAEFHHLVAVDDLDDHSDAEGVDAFDMLKSTIDPEDEMSVPEFNEMMFGTSRAPNQQVYAVKFIEGMQALYNEIKDKI